MLHNIDLNKMRVFAAVYEGKSVSKAAEKLYISPSAVSQSLRGLETEIGLRLFQRIAKRMVPTEEAATLYLTITKFLKEAEALIEEGKSRGSEPKGSLKIGAPPEFGSRRVVKEIAKMSRYQGCDFTIEFALPDELTRRVANSELDLAFCDEGSYLKNYERLVSAEEIFSEEAVMVASRAFHKKNLSDGQGYQKLSKVDHVDYREDGGVLALWYRHHFRKSPKLKIRMVANNVRAMIEAAKAGIGLAFIPTYLIEKELKSGALVEIDTGKKAYANPILLVRLKDKVPSRLEREFVGQFGR